MNTSALFTDFYELTMAQAYWKRGMNRPVVYDMFFRRQPWNGGFSVFAGLDPLLDHITDFHFSRTDISFLEQTGVFSPDFLNWLTDFRFTGDIWAMAEGTIVFPDEPLLRIHGTAAEAAIIEGLILNQINFHSLIATKTARISLATRGAPLMEFGLRRAQGFDGAMSASRAAYIGGATGTSNTLAASRFGIPPMGTMAHSWVMSFPDETSAFTAWAKLYPTRSVFLIDTWNTLESGLPAAITAGRQLAAQGHNFGVRLDSGDIQYLSSAVRSALDEAGLENATIAVSNELNEQIIESLVLNKAPIDSWGVGTHMVTGGEESSFTGVYKLAAHSADDGSLIPTMKVSDNPQKSTNPGIKQVWRLLNPDASLKADILSLHDDPPRLGGENCFYHPSNDWQRFSCVPEQMEALLHPVLKDGCRLNPTEPLEIVRTRVRTGLAALDPTYKRILNPHVYKVSLTRSLHDLKVSFLTAGKQP